MTTEEFWQHVLTEYKRSCFVWWHMRGIGKPNKPGRQYVYGLVIKQFGYQWLKTHIDEIIGKLDAADKEVLAAMSEAQP